MEIVEEVEKVVENVLLLNEQPEFIENCKEKFNARFFVVCENLTETNLPKNAYECSVAGLNLAEWVMRACESDPIVLRVDEGSDILRLIKPYTSGADYSVVLYASTPFVRKQHIRDLLGFVSRRHLGVCKLKKGYIFKNDYIDRVDKIFSIDTYDFESDDFFEVKSLRELEYAELILTRRIFDFHRKNQVTLSGRNITIDATAEIGYNTTISGGAAVLKKSKIGADSEICSNAVISGCKLGDDVVVGEGAIVKDSVIKDGAVISAGAVITGSVVGERTTVGVGAIVSHSGIKQNVNIGDGAKLIGARVAENAVIKAFAKVVMVEEPAVVLSNAVVSEGAEVYDTTVVQEQVIKPFSKYTKNR